MSDDEMIYDEKTGDCLIILEDLDENKSFQKNDGVYLPDLIIQIENKISDLTIKIIRKILSFFCE